MVLQSVMTVCASSTESNASTESTSSRTREPERLHERVLPRRAGLDEAAAGRALNGRTRAVSILMIGESSLGLPGSAPIILLFFDKTPRYMPLDDSESAGVMPQTVRGRHGSCSCASQT